MDWSKLIQPLADLAVRAVGVVVNAIRSAGLKKEEQDKALDDLFARLHATRAAETADEEATKAALAGLPPEPAKG